ncbi:hypothetical protein ACLKA7_011630 [Drosophila subpalustris]
MWNQWPIAAVPAGPISAPPQPLVPPPLPDAPPPPPPLESATDAVSAGVSGAGTATAGYIAPVAAQTASNPYDQYTAAQYAAMTPEQQYALQQHWQQWQTYQQDYAKWHAQYGEQYKREMAAAAATTVPTVTTAPVVAPVPAIGTVYPQAQLVQQMTVQPQIQTYLPQPPQPQTQSQLSGKIMAQPQMYNQPPPPPPQGYQQHPQPQQLQRHQQGPPSNQWTQQPAPGRLNQVPPVNYNQAPNPGDPSTFPNLQQPPPSFMSQPPLSGNQIDASWSKEQNKNRGDRGNIIEADQRKRWDGPPPDVGRQQQQHGPPHNRWQSTEQVNNKNKGANKPNQFGNRRNWQNNPPGNNKTSNIRNNPFSSAAPSHYGSVSDNSSRNAVGSTSNNFRDDAADPGDCNSNTSGGIGCGSRSSNSNVGIFGNNGSGQGSADNFGSGSFDNNCRGVKSNTSSGRWEHNHQNQSGVNFGPSHDSNSDCGYNRVPNQNNFNQQQQQRAPDLDEASFDRLFDQWEKQFEDWKCANANHPDRDEYRRYEEEFEKQRRRIAERREQMRRRRQMQNPQQSQQANQQPYPKAQQQHQLQQPQKSVNSGVPFENYEEDANRCEQHNRCNTPKDVNTEGQHGLPNTYEEKEAQCFELEQEQVGAKLEQSQQSTEKQMQQRVTKTAQSLTPTTSPSSRYEQKQPHQEVEKNKYTPNILGKRKTNDSVNMGATSTPAKTAKEDKILIISLDDDDDDADYVQKQQADNKEGSAVYTPMKNIFKKTDGIPGLDLVADGRAAVPPAVSTASRPTDASNADKKIPSLFDVVIAKPRISPPTEVITDSDKEPATTKTTISETLPDDVSKALKDPEFMNNLSQALAQAQGRDREQLQRQPQSNEHYGNNNSSNSSNINNDSSGGRPMSFAEWQRKKNNLESNQQDEEPIRSMSSFGAGSGNGPGNRGGYGPDSGDGFGPDQQSQQRYGPNGPGPGDSQLMGPNFTDFTGPPRGNLGFNGPPSGTNFGPNNGPRPGHGPNPGQFGGGPGPFGRNFGPGGPNNPNFLGPGPNYNDRGQNFGPNFRGNGPVFRPNFCASSGPGPGPNFGNPARFCGPGPNNRNFGPNNPNQHNYGLGPNSSNERNFGSAHHNSNFIDPNMSNNKNSSFVDNPFRRNGGPQAPNFDDSPREPRGKGPLRSTFGNVGNNKPWADGYVS